MLTNLIAIAVLLNDVSVWCKDAKLPEHLFRNGTINCLTLKENMRQPKNDNLCIFRALGFHLQGNQRLQKSIKNLQFVYQ